MNNYILALAFVIFCCSCEKKENFAKVTEQWNSAHNNHNLNLVESFYADTVFYYGKNKLKKEVVESKRKHLKNDYNQKILSEIDVFYNNDKIICLFEKEFSESNKKVSAQFCLVFSKDGRIIEEMDEITLRNTSKTFAKNISSKFLKQTDKPQKAKSLTHKEMKIDAENALFDYFTRDCILELLEIIDSTNPDTGAPDLNVEVEEENGTLLKISFQFYELVENEEESHTLTTDWRFVDVKNCTITSNFELPEGALGYDKNRLKKFGSGSKSGKRVILASK